MSERITIQQAKDQCGRRLESLGDASALKCGCAAYVAHISTKSTRRTLDQITSNEIVTAERKALEEMAERECHDQDFSCREILQEQSDWCAVCWARQTLQGLST